MKLFGFARKVVSYFVFTLLLSQCLHCSYLKPARDHIEVTQVYKTIYISSDFNETEIKLIRESARDWENSTSNLVRFEIQTSFKGDYNSFLGEKDFYIVFLKCPADSPKTIAVDEQIKKQEMEERAKERAKNNDTKEYKDEQYSYALAFYQKADIVPTIYMISDRMKTTDRFRQTVSHEIGHALGLDHNEKIDSIMYRSMDKAAKHVTPNDISCFCKLHFCPTEVKTELKVP